MRIDRLINALMEFRMGHPEAEVGFCTNVTKEGCQEICIKYSLSASNDGSVVVLVSPKDERLCKERGGW